MNFYYSLREVAKYIGYFSTYLLTSASEIANVYIVGNALAARFISWGVQLAWVRSWLYNAADDWLDAWNELRNSSIVSSTLSTLIYWADDLAAFASDPDGWIRDAIKSRFPAGARLLTDPAGEVIEIILKRTGIPYDLLFNARNYIANLFVSILGNLRAIYNDPDGWLIGKLNQFFPAAYRILRDPDGWLIGKINSAFPVIAEFIRDPDTFIIEHLIAFLERFVNRYGKRLAKIAESIIHLIW